MSDEEERRFARLVVDEMFKRIQQEVGRSVMKKAFWVIFSLFIVAMLWLGIIKIPG